MPRVTIGSSATAQGLRTLTGSRVPRIVISWAIRSPWSVDLLPALQHRDEFAQTALAGLGLLRLVQPVDDRVAVGAVQRLEGLTGGRVWIQLAPQVVWNPGTALPLVGGIPAPVGPGRLDLGQSGRAHAAGGDQLLRLVAVDPRPPAP